MSSVCKDQAAFNTAYKESLEASPNVCKDQDTFNTTMKKIPPEMILGDNHVCTDQDTFNHAYAKAVDKYNDIEYGKLTANQKIVFTILLALQCVFIMWGIILAIKFVPSNQRPVHIVFAITTGPIYVLAFYLSKIGGKLKG